jgi:hypothetical protein
MRNATSEQSAFPPNRSIPSKQEWRKDINIGLQVLTRVAVKNIAFWEKFSDVVKEYIVSIFRVEQ